MRRHGVGNLNALKPKDPQPTHKAFKAYEPGYVHIDVTADVKMPHIAEVKLTH